MIRNTTGIDVVLGGHNHIVINPPQQIQDCTCRSAEPRLHLGGRSERRPARRPGRTDPTTPPTRNLRSTTRTKFKRACKPRNVILAHSGAFAKYVGRLDSMLSNDPEGRLADRAPEDYDPINGFEVVSSRVRGLPRSTSSGPGGSGHRRHARAYRRSARLAWRISTSSSASRPRREAQRAPAAATRRSAT